LPEKIIRQSIPVAMHKCYIDYAMSVIIDRALPDGLDGLKPVHRRILYAMHELGLYPERPYMKCARTVGDVLGKFHPHGDQSVYGAQVGLAQDFNTRYPLVDGHGNFGSIDGDPAAAMRYTEAKLTRIGAYMLKDINKNTVDFKKNFDEKEDEPVILPSFIPNILVNGTEGIAVGMATKMPPHNINDVYDAILHLIDKAILGEEANIDDLIAIIKAPDFPGGGIISNLKGAVEAYKTGKGKIIVNSKYEIEEIDGKRCVIVTELPYKVNKAKLCLKIADLIKDKKIEGISDIRDESDKDGMRMVIELKRDANQQIVINNLLKQTQLQEPYSFNMTMIVNKRPVVLNLKDILENFLAHMASCVMRKTQFDLDKANNRVNLVNAVIRLFEGDTADRVIDIIRTEDEPVAALVEKLDFNQAQAEYLFESKLRALTKASRTKFDEERAQLDTNISEWTAILSDESVLLSFMKTTVLELKEMFGDERRSQIADADFSLNESDLIEEEMLIVTITTDGLIKSVEEKEYKTQGRGGKGVKAATSKDEESVRYMLTVNSKDDIMFFTNLGRCHNLKAYKINKATRTARGKSINNYLNLAEDEYVVSILATNLADPNKCLFFVTKKGIVKRLSFDQLSTKYSSTKVVGFKEGDELVTALVVEEDSQVIMTTELGMSIRIAMNAEGTHAIRPMGRGAAGVKGINLAEDDNIVDMVVVNDESTLLTVAENGLGKRTKVSEFSVQGRGGKGIIAHKITKKTGKVVSATTVADSDELFIATKQGLITRINASAVSIIGRNTSGVKVINLNEGDYVVSISKGDATEEEEQAEE
jgi:DNA gyrase subunit A